MCAKKLNEGFSSVNDNNDVFTVQAEVLSVHFVGKKVFLCCFFLFFLLFGSVVHIQYNFVFTCSSYSRVSKKRRWNIEVYGVSIILYHLLVCMRTDVAHIAGRLLCQECWRPTGRQISLCPYRVVSLAGFTDFGYGKFQLCLCYRPLHLVGYWSFGSYAIHGYCVRMPFLLTVILFFCTLIMRIGHVFLNWSLS